VVPDQEWRKAVDQAAIEGIQKKLNDVLAKPRPC
jgi:hypothetical protein